jgi:predicted DNA-binding transcriptional regulator YafY
MPPRDVYPFLTTRPQTKRELAERMGVTTRTVEVMVQVERLAGAPIVSDTDGYRVALDSADMRDQYRRMRSRYVHQALTARAVNRTADRMEAAEAAALRPAGTLWDLDRLECAA